MALCSGCKFEFVSKELIVFTDGSVHCATCAPKIRDQYSLVISLRLGWDEANSLIKVINSDAGYEDLTRAEGIKADLESQVNIIARKLMSNVTKVQKSYSESMGSGDAEHRDFPDNGESRSSD